MAQGQVQQRFDILGGIADAVGKVVDKVEQVKQDWDESVCGQMCQFVVGQEAAGYVDPRCPDRCMKPEWKKAVDGNIPPAQGGADQPPAEG